MCGQDFGFSKKGMCIGPSFQKNLPTDHPDKEKDQSGYYRCARFLLPHTKGKLVSKRRASLLPGQEKSINIQRRLNIFQDHRAELNELAGKFVVDLIINLLAKANPAWHCQRLNSRGNVHAIAKNIALSINHIAQMKANADLN